MIQDDGHILQLELVQCLCETLEELELPKVCRCAPMPGATYALDFGPDQLGQGNGQAWVRLVGVGPTFPGDTGDNLATIILAAKCNSPLVYEFEVGISRCEPVGVSRNNKYTPPGEAETTAAVELYAADRAAMKQAILCCLPQKLGDDIEVGLGIYTPLDSDGGVGGGTWQAFVRRS